MQLRYIGIPLLIAEAGGDPWAIDQSLQAGRPAQISDLGRRFMLPAGAPRRRTPRLIRPGAASRKPESAERRAPDQRLR